jgi:hypothetical protein
MGKASFKPQDHPVGRLYHMNAKAFVAIAAALSVALSGCGAASQTLTVTNNGGGNGSAKKKSHTKVIHMTTSQANAVEAAKQYLQTESFSKKGLIQQLSSQAGEGYPMKDAVFAVKHIQVNWNEEAVKSAKQYLQTQAFSRSGLLQQLESSAGEGFTHAQAEYGVKHAYS